MQPTARYSWWLREIPLETKASPARSNFLPQPCPFAPTPIWRVSSTSVYAYDSCCPSFHPQRPKTPSQSLSDCTMLTPNPYAAQNEILRRSRGRLHRNCPNLSEMTSSSGSRGTLLMNGSMSQVSPVGTRVVSEIDSDCT